LVVVRPALAAMINAWKDFEQEGTEEIELEQQDRTTTEWESLPV
jgi:hypothetical protein